MIETYPTDQPEPNESDPTVAEAESILDGYSPEAIRAAAKLTTQLPHMHVIGGELALKYTLEEQIQAALSR